MFDKNVFGARLSALRREKGLKQAELGKLLGVTPTQVSDMEQGNSATTMARFYQLCEFFDVSADYLLGRADEPGPILQQTEDECADCHR